MDQWMRDARSHGHAITRRRNHNDVEIEGGRTVSEIVEELVGNHDTPSGEFKHLSCGYQFGVHLSDLGRTTEGFYDTALNEASDA
ncbi:hypothetical protein RE6C_05935 [Rhodopirellula europaea 6C]|uniref:Uncharacterized protein n=2 Tax=Rhodopirellula TaxID=265488 RepID=M2A388_9BACT|nr:hypothetical protein RE6C_05935 [Rhodopirellula europaea 6C]